MSLSYFLDAAPFVLYTALLFRVAVVWKWTRKRLSECHKIANCSCKGTTFSEKSNLLLAILLLLALCTLTFMASNVYTLAVFDKSLFSIRVFQMFALGNSAAYWLVLDLITSATKDVD